MKKIILAESRVGVLLLVCIAVFLLQLATVEGNKHSVRHAFLSAKHVCITLDRRPDRWKAFMAQAAEIPSLSFERHPAYDGTRLTQEAIMDSTAISVETKNRLINKKQRLSDQQISSTGAIGCYLSHVQTWRDFLNGTADYLAVFEDDASLPVDYLNRLATLPLPPLDWDVIVMCARYRTGVYVGEDGWQWLTGFQGSHAILLSRKGAQTLLDYAFPIEVQLDAYIAVASELGLITAIYHPDAHIPLNLIYAVQSDISHQPLMFTWLQTLLLCSCSIMGALLLRLCLRRVSCAWCCCCCKRKRRSAMEDALAGKTGFQANLQDIL